MSSVTSSLANSKSLLVCIVDLNGTYTYVNDTFKERFAYLGVDFIGQSALVTIEKEDHAALMEAVKATFAFPNQVHSVRLRKLAKSPFAALSYSDWELHPQLNSEGNLADILIIGRENSVNDLQIELLKSISDSFYIIDSNNVIGHAHVSLNRYSGNSQNEIKNKEIFSILPEYFHQKAREAVQLVCSGGKSDILNYSQKNERGEQHFNVQIVPIAFQGLIHSLWIEKDITQQTINQLRIDASLMNIRRMWDTMPVLLHSLNKDWEIEYANSKWEEVFELKKEDYLNKNFWDVFPRAIGADFEDYYRKAIEDGIPSLNNDSYYSDKDIWFSIDVYPWTNGIVVYTRDVTQNKKLELKDQQMELRLSRVWESIIDGYLLLDKDWVISYANPAWISMFKKEDVDVIGKKFYDLFPAIKGHSFNKVLVDASKSNEVQRELVYFEYQDIWVNTVVYPSEDGLAVNMQDVSSQERMKSAMSDLSFMTSHELRHEYAKLHSVINLLSVSNEDENFLLKEAHKSLIQINSLISLMNDKLTFNRDNSTGRNGSDWMEFEEAILIDDDHVINFINARVIRLMFPGSRVKSFVSAEKALSYLKEFDKMGKKLIFIDLNMPSFDGWDFLEAYQHLPFKSPIYVLTSSINPKDIERSMQFSEVVKFLTKPLSSDLLESERIRPVEFKS